MVYTIVQPTMGYTTSAYTMANTHTRSISCGVHSKNDGMVR